MSSVAVNVSWRCLLVAANVSSRPALFASPRADDVELLQLGRRCDHLAHACKPGVRRGVGHTVSVCLFRLGHTEFFALYAEPVHSGCDAKNLEQRPNSYAPGMCCASSASSCSGSRCDPPRIQRVGGLPKLTESTLSEIEWSEERGTHDGVLKPPSYLVPSLTVPRYMSF
jgi:hypothetical protein